MRLVHLYARTCICCSLTLFAVAGCTPPDAAPSGSAEAGLDGWQISAAPILRIGEEGVPEYEFTEIIGLGRLRSGGWTAFDRGTHQLRFYDRAGRHVRDAGRAGDGPGEFRDVYFMTVLEGRTIYVYDQGLRRLTVWNEHGALMRTSAVFAPDAGSPLTPVGLATDEVLVWEQSLFPQCVENTLADDTVVFYAHEVASRGLDGDAAVTADRVGRIARVPGRQRWGNRINPMGRCLPQPVPFAPGPLAVAGGGYLISVPRSGESVARHDVEGGAYDVLPLHMPRRVLDRQLIDAYIDRAVGSTMDETGRPLPVNPLYERSLRSIPYPDSLPLLDQLLVSADGFLWLRGYTLGDDTLSEWLILSPGGRASRLSLPARVHLLEVGRSYAAGVQRDRFDVEHIVVFELRRAPD